MTNWPVEFALDAESFGLYSEIGEPICGRTVPGVPAKNYTWAGVRSPEACKAASDWMAYEMRKR